MNIIEIVDIVGRITIDILAGIGAYYLIELLKQGFK